MLVYISFVFPIILQVYSLDLLGLQLSVPALQKEGSLTHVLTNSQKVKPISILPTVGTPCKQSYTKINGGQAICSNVLLFEDYFNTGNVNTNYWIKQQYIPYSPDYEFVTYEKRSQNCYINGGILHLKPTIREQPDIIKLDLSNGCTGQNCTANAVSTILPPIIAGKIKSKFSFLYGKVEIRAQLPQGDWIFPQIYLEPKGYAYGEGYKSGRIWLAYSRGNLKLQRENEGEEIGNSVLYSGVVLSETEPSRTYSTQKIRNSLPWGDNFHVYTLVWSPEGFTILVDGIEQGFISPPFSNSGSPYSHLWSGDMSPFDQEFVVTLGVAAGGITDFPEGSTSNGLRKPWKRTSARSTLLFYNAKDQWYPTWVGDKSALKIDYVKIWSL